MSDKTQPTPPAKPSATDAATGQPIQVNLVQPDRAAEGAQNQLDGLAILAAHEKPGVYLVNGIKVDGNGVPVKGDG